jgi:hypothetical protein
MKINKGMIIRQLRTLKSVKIAHIINIFGDHFESLSLFIVTVYLTHLTTLGSKLNLIEETDGAAKSM